MSSRDGATTAKFRLEPMGADLTKFGLIMKESIKTFEKFRSEVATENISEIYQNFETIRTNLKRFGGNFQLMQMVLEGIFGFYYREWRKYFPEKNILVIDGSKLNSEASGEILRVQNFLEIPEKISAKNFTFNDQRHLLCLKGRQGQNRFEKIIFLLVFFNVKIMRIYKM